MHSIFRHGIALLMLISMPVLADFEIQKDANGVALAGHDPVAYFTEGKPVEGKEKLTAVHDGAIYHFDTEENRDAFKADPEKYLPAYGGYCAYGMTFGQKFPVNGKGFRIEDGKLYVNKDEQVHSEWEKDIPKHLQEAESFWPRVKEAAPDAP
jgi:YHS domain-containing protein